MLGLTSFECRPSWHALQFSKSHDLYEVAAGLAGGEVSWHGECLAKNDVGKELASAALDGISPQFVGSDEWGNSASRGNRKQFKLAFDVLCCWPRYGGRASLTETYPPRGAIREDQGIKVDRAQSTCRRDPLCGTESATPPLC